MILEILKFIFSNFFIWFGFVIIFAIIIDGIRPFKGMIDRSIHIHIDGEELDGQKVKQILKNIK